MLCFFGNTYYTIPMWVNATNQNAFVCSNLDFHRDSQLCGACQDGYVLPVYSYSLACVECEHACSVHQIWSVSEEAKM